jgi:hypothetical protein
MEIASEKQLAMVNAVYTDLDNKLDMIEFNGLVYPVLKEHKTIKPLGNVVFVQELFIDENYIEVSKDDNSYIVSVRIDNDTINEFRAN